MQDEAELREIIAAIQDGRIKVFQPSTAQLPKWTIQGDGFGSSSKRNIGYTCDDPADHAFALDVMMMTGFSVPAFDTWLDSIGSGESRNGLIIRREYLRDALLANNEEAVWRHAEYLSNCRSAIERETVLLPMAQRDEKRQAGVKVPRRPEVDAWIKRQLERNPLVKSPALYAIAPDWLTEQVGADRFAKRVTAARKLGKGRK